jgi:hypothetical protein
MIQTLIHITLFAQPCLGSLRLVLVDTLCLACHSANFDSTLRFLLEVQHQRTLPPNKMPASNAVTSKADDNHNDIAWAQVSAPCSLVFFLGPPPIVVLIPEIEAFQRVFTLFVGEASVGAHLRKSDKPRMVFVDEIEIRPDRGGTGKGSAPDCPALFFCFFGAIASSSRHIISSFLCGCKWQGSAAKRSSGRERVASVFPFSMNAKESNLWTPLWSRQGARLVIAPGVVTIRVLGAVLIAADLSTGREKEEHDHTPRNRWSRKRRLNSPAKPSVTTPDHRAPAQEQSALRSLHIRVSSLLQWMAFNPTRARCNVSAALRTRVHQSSASYFPADLLNSASCVSDLCSVFSSCMFRVVCLLRKVLAHHLLRNGRDSKTWYINKFFRAWCPCRRTHVV